MNYRYPNEIINDYLYKKGISKRKLSKMIGETNYSNFWQKLEKNDLNTALIAELCIALDYDFFHDIGKELRKANPKIKTSEKPNTDLKSEVDDAIVKLIADRFPSIINK